MNIIKMLYVTKTAVFSIIAVLLMSSVCLSETGRIILGSEVITGWTQYAPTVWKSSLEIKPVHVMSNDEWLSKGFDKNDLNHNMWYWESNILYLKDIEGNPAETGKTITAIVRDGGGRSVTSGDFNGNGLSDIVAADPVADGIDFNTGEVYIYYGNDEFSTIPDQILTDPDGNPKDEFGYYVASAGDVNSDGYDELIVAMNWGVNKVYIYMGSQQGLKDAPDITLTPPVGYPAYGFGHRISLRSGDINSDGFDDILIGGGDKPAYFCVYYGSPSGIDTDPDVVVAYSNTTNYIDISFIGDINNDGFYDIAVSPRKFGPTTNCDVYVYYGSSEGFSEESKKITIDIGWTHPYGFTVTLAPAGDVNRDGFDDLLVGNQWAIVSYEMAGQAYIFYGSSKGLSDSPNVTIDNPIPNYNARFGNSVDGIGDFNYDGFDDIIVGCPYGGFASIYYGSPEGVVNTPSLTLTEVGAFGWSVSNAGDIKGNRQNFIIVGDEFGGAYMYSFLAFWHVDGDINVSGNGTNWGEAFKTIQEAIDEARVTNEIWVKQGTYFIGSTIRVNKSVSIYGGFDGTETELSQRSLQTKSIIDGQNSVRCITVDADATIDGFTIVNGFTTQGGGGMSIGLSAARISNCIFSDNQAGWGGGLSIYKSPSTISNCIFDGNSANNGAGIHNRESSPTIINSTFSNNNAIHGGAITNYLNSSPMIVNSILWGDTATNGPEIYNYSSNPIVRYCDIDQGGYAGSNGNIREDPLFHINDSVGDVVEQFNTFRLRSDSPCIDAGTSQNAPNQDIDGDPRPWGAGVDIGADECIPPEDYWTDDRMRNAVPPPMGIVVP